MPWLSPFDLDRLLRVWFYRLVKVNTSPAPTQKPILSHYSSTLDHIVQLDNDLMQEAVKLAATYDKRSEADVLNALCAVVNGVPVPKGPASTATRVLEVVVARINYGNTDDRLRIAEKTPQVLDFLRDLFYKQPPSQQKTQTGGAAAIVAQVLTQLGEPDVALWAIYHSPQQAAVFDEAVKFLEIREQCSYAAQPVRTVGRAGDPDIRNYSLEFAKDTQFTFAAGIGCVASAAASDRVIVISPGYQFVAAATGYVDTTRTPRSVPAHILAADPWRAPTCAQQVSQHYKYWFLGGLHAVSDATAQSTLDDDLQQVPPDVTIHVEIPNAKISPWFQDILRRHVNSAGVNAEDVAGLVETVVNSGPVHAPPPPPPADLGDAALRQEYLLCQAFWLVCEFDLERLYIHGLELDYIIRRQASDAEMQQEVRADLLAKITVANRARGVGVTARAAATFGLPVGNLLTFINVCSLRAYPVTPWGVNLLDLPTFTRILEQGWFEDRFECRDQKSASFRVAVVPVALFQLDPVGVKFVGSGDTTSAVSFVFGCFKTRALKRL